MTREEANYRSGVIGKGEAGGRSGVEHAGRGSYNELIASGTQLQVVRGASDSCTLQHLFAASFRFDLNHRQIFFVRMGSCRSTSVDVQ